jgi:hypothetical protein
MRTIAEIVMERIVCIEVLDFTGVVQIAIIEKFTELKKAQIFPIAL